MNHVHVFIDAVGPSITTPPQTESALIANDTVAIIGGVSAVVIVLIIAATVLLLAIVVIFCIRKHKQSKLSQR